MGQFIEDAILHNKDAKMNLRHPFLIYGLCKKVGVPLKSNEVWIHSIKAIVVKKNKSDVPIPKGVYESRNKPSNEEELRAYQFMYGGRHDERGEVGQSSTQPLPSSAHEEEDPSPPHPIEDQVQDHNEVQCILGRNTRTSCLDELRDGRAKAQNEHSSK